MIPDPDLQRVIEAAQSGDPEAIRAIQADADQIREQMRAKYGTMNIAVDLVREARGQSPRASDERLEEFELFAWVGEDEHGSGEIGLKQAWLPNIGISPMVGIKQHEDRIKSDRITIPLKAQADAFGKRIHLIRLKFVEEITILIPRNEKVPDETA